jgi:hypothetical protein
LPREVILFNQIRGRISVATLQQTSHDQQPHPRA